MDINYQNILNARQVSRENIKMQAGKAILRSEFLEKDNAVIYSVLRGDLKKHMEDNDINNVIPTTLDEFVPSFLDQICNVYDTPPVFKFDDKLKGKDRDIMNFTKLMEEVKIHQVLQQNNKKMRLHNCILDYVKYNPELDIIFIENDYTIGTCKVFTYPSYRYEPKAVAFETYNEKDEKIWIVWDRKDKNTIEHYITDEEPSFDADTGLVTVDRRPVGKNKDFTGPAYWPWTVYRYEEHNSEFWGNGMDWLINLSRVINLMLTVTGDDAIQQNLRLLILNFTPIGTETEDEYPEKNQSSNKRIKSGMRHPIFAKENNNPGASKNSTTPHGEVVSGDLNLDAMVQFVRDLSDMAASLHGVDSTLKKEIESSLSGIAMAIKNQPKMIQWSKDIQTLRPFDRKLIKSIIEVNNYYRTTEDTTKKIDLAILDYLTIDYQRPRVVTDEKAEYELEKMKWGDGVSSPILWVKRHHPEMDDKQAEEYVRNNLSKWNELQGIDTIPINPPVNEDE